MQLTSRLTTLGLSLVLVLLIDGSAGPADAAPGTTGDAAPNPATAAARPASPAVQGPPTPWKDMNYSERNKYMRRVVAPRMKVVFQAFDAKEFKRFKCATCHGKNHDDRKFKMPSPDLHALPSTPEAFQAKLKSEPTWPKWTKFMSEQVQPQMAALLGLPAFDHKKPEAGGFSCQACHTLTKS